MPSPLPSPPSLASFDPLRHATIEEGAHAGRPAAPAAGDGDRLAALMAHEMNNLLMVVIGNLDLLEPELPDTESARECVREVRAAVDRGTALTRRALSLARRPEEP